MAPTPNPVVTTRSGAVEGLVRAGVRCFRGIPFARPPVGPLRFAAPVREEPWKGIRRAHDFGFSAPQRPMLLPLPGMDVGPMDEDCLTLNVYTPDAGPTGRASGSPAGRPAGSPVETPARRPVLVWIHGGGFVIGSGSQAIYDGGPLVRRGDVVVVTVNYRLGPLGFLHLSDLCPGLEGAVANAGIRDQVAALEWVRENIAAFGGDPENVTIFGESAGGMSVGTLLGMPAARGLFRRAILESGAAHNVHTRETATEVARRFLQEVGVEPGEAASVLRTLPPDKLLDSHQQTVLKLGTSLGLLVFQPVVDGDSLPESPLAAVQHGRAAGVDVLIGTTSDEWRLFGILDPNLAKLDFAGLQQRLASQLGGDAQAAGQSAERAERVLAAYRQGRPNASPQDLFFAIETDRVFRVPALRVAEAQQAHGERVFVYEFAWASPAMGGALGACHAVELPFVFGHTALDGVEQFVGKGPEAERLSQTTMDAWLAFARTGDPSHTGLPGGRWPGYDLQRRATMRLDRQVELDEDPRSGEREVWDGLV